MDSDILVTITKTNTKTKTKSNTKTIKTETNLENYIKTKTKTNLILKQIKQIFKKCYESMGTKQNINSVTASSSSSDGSQLSTYVLEVEDHHLATFDASDTMNFWNNQVNTYDKLSLIAQDILAAPERGLSVCGLLTAGRRNRMTKSLQMRVCLKLNKKNVLPNTGINSSV